MALLEEAICSLLFKRGGGESLDKEATLGLKEQYLDFYFQGAIVGLQRPWFKSERCMAKKENSDCCALEGSANPSRTKCQLAKVRLATAVCELST